MRVLSVIIASPLRKVSGATNAGRELSAATARLIDIELAVMWDADERDSMGPLDIHYMKCTNRLGAAASLAPRMVRVPLYDSRIPELILKNAYDLVHIHNLVPSFAAERVAKACMRSGTPYVVSTHGFVELDQYAAINGFGRLKSALVDIAITRPFHRIVKNASGIFALSDCEGPLLSRLGVADEKIHIVTNGVNEYFLDPPDADALSGVKSRFLRGADPVLLFMGSLHAYKGVDTFLKSLSGLSRPFQAIVAGRLKNEQEKQALLRNSGLPAEIVQRVTFTGGITNEELRALYHSADIFVYPTRGDTLPLVVLEAMACGRPVVASRIGGLPFEVTPDTGLLTPPGDAAAVTGAVNHLLENATQRDAMGRAGRARVEQVFRWAQAAQAAVRGYQAVLGVPIDPVELAERKPPSQSPVAAKQGATAEI